MVYCGYFTKVLWLKKNKTDIIILPCQVTEILNYPDGSLLIRNHKDEYIVTCIKGHAFEDESLKNKIENNSLAAFKKVEYLDKPLKKNDIVNIVIIEHSFDSFSKCYFQAYIIQTVHKDGTYTITKKGKNPKRIAKKFILAKLAYKLCDLNPKYLEYHSNF